MANNLQKKNEKNVCNTKKYTKMTGFEIIGGLSQPQ